MNGRKYKRKLYARTFRCTECGKPLENTGYLLCISCREKRRIYQTSLREKKAKVDK